MPPTDSRTGHSTERDAPRLIDGGSAVDRAGLVHRVARSSVPGPARTCVMLHGRAGSEDRMWVFASTVPADWLVVAPRGPVRDIIGGWSWRARRTDEWPPLAAFDGAVAAAVRFISALPDLYGADPEHVYLMGFSQGAATAYATAMRHPGLVRGVAGLVGFVPGDCDDEVVAAPLRRLPVFMAVGRRDPLIPFARSRACARALRAAGARLEAHEYDEGHRLSASAMRDLAAWWAERDLAP